MKRLLAPSSFLVLGLLLTPGCGDSGDDSSTEGETATATATPTASGATNTPTDEEKLAVVENYSEIVYQSYSDALTLTETLDAAIQAFVAAPSAETQTAAKDAWLAARRVYGQTEVYRFYSGPIDDEDGPEGAINAWPMDEAHVDYVQNGVDGEIIVGGIINDLDTYPEITKAVIADTNELGGEANVSSGYHAIEFLLWGQDLYADSAGLRSFEDYVVGSEIGGPNPERRATYLTEVSALLIEDLSSVVAEWAPDTEGNYRASFMEDVDDAIARILVGIGTMAGGELSGERIYVAYETKDQEDEHSCFSDNTHVDIWANAQGVQNVYLGNYGTVDGPGIDSLVAIVDSDLDTTIQGEIAAAMTAVEAIPAPFDQAILGADDAEGRVAIYAAVEALILESESVVDVATALGYTISIELE